MTDIPNVETPREVAYLMVGYPESYTIEDMKLVRDALEPHDFLRFRLNREIRKKWGEVVVTTIFPLVILIGLPLVVFIVYLIGC